MYLSLRKRTGILILTVIIPETLILEFYRNPCSKRPKTARKQSARVLFVLPCSCLFFGGGVWAKMGQDRAKMGQDAGRMRPTWGQDEAKMG